MSLSKFPCYKPKPINYRADLRIVGGFDAVQRETPYMVGLMKHGGVVCGASIISEKFLIIAAHCICNNQNHIIKPSQLKAFVGMNKITDVKNEIEDDTIAEVFIKKIIVHPDYSCGKTSQNDIALLQLESSIKFNDNIQPLCLSTDESQVMEIGIVTGWGWTNEDLSVGEKPNVLQTADVPIWSNEECQKSYKNLMKTNQISDKQMCAGARNGGIDSCWADSGGPLINKLSGNLIGVVSTGVGCARKGLPGIYTRVSHYTKWIRSIVAI
ncbi:CLUMA_CG020251, isoform A [Clunio marinus]|uniref:limulus clotting factor C n=1 Tax=Clunio marinus TaxID=568069 RepID=A0A1J1J4E5_9DIPT|nr:CLUMA_CG020251, isoform A [Clunio marinus]